MQNTISEGVTHSRTEWDKGHDVEVNQTQRTGSSEISESLESQLGAIGLGEEVSVISIELFRS
jgi:hypothetical protein